MPPPQPNMFNRPYVPLSLGSLRPEVHASFADQVEMVRQQIVGDHVLRKKGQATGKIIVTIDLTHDQSTDDFAISVDVQAKVPGIVGHSDAIHTDPRSGTLYVPDYTAAEPDQVTMLGIVNNPNPSK